MKISLTVTNSEAPSGKFCWGIMVGEFTVALGYAPTHYHAARRCGAAFLQFCEEQGWMRKPPADVEVVMNYIPPLPEAPAQPLRAGVQTSAH